MAIQDVTEESKRDTELEKQQQQRSEAWFSLITNESFSLSELDVFNDFEKRLDMI